MSLGLEVVSLLSLIIKDYREKKDKFIELQNTYSTLLNNNNSLIKINENMRAAFEINNTHRTRNPITMYSIEPCDNIIIAMLDKYENLRNNTRRITSEISITIKENTELEMEADIFYNFIVQVDEFKHYAQALNSKFPLQLQLNATNKIKELISGGVTIPQEIKMQVRNKIMGLPYIEIISYSAEDFEVPEDDTDAMRKKENPIIYAVGKVHIYYKSNGETSIETLNKPSWATINLHMNSISNNYEKKYGNDDNINKDWKLCIGKEVDKNYHEKCIEHQSIDQTIFERNANYDPIIIISTSLLEKVQPQAKNQDIQYIVEKNIIIHYIEGENKKNKSFYHKSYNDIQKELELFTGNTNWKICNGLKIEGGDYDSMCEQNNFQDFSQNSFYASAKGEIPIIIASNEYLTSGYEYEVRAKKVYVYYNTNRYYSTLSLNNMTFDEINYEIKEIQMPNDDWKICIGNESAWNDATLRCKEYKSFTKDNFNHFVRSNLNKDVYLASIQYIDYYYKTNSDDVPLELPKPSPIIQSADPSLFPPIPEKLNLSVPLDPKKPENLNLPIDLPLQQLNDLPPIPKMLDPKIPIDGKKEPIPVVLDNPNINNPKPQSRKIFIYKLDNDKCSKTDFVFGDDINPFLKKGNWFIKTNEGPMETDENPKFEKFSEETFNKNKEGEGDMHIIEQEFYKNGCHKQNISIKYINEHSNSITLFYDDINNAFSKIIELIKSTYNVKWFLQFGNSYDELNETDIDKYISGSKFQIVSNLYLKTHNLHKIKEYTPDIQFKYVIKKDNTYRDEFERVNNYVINPSYENNSGWLMHIEDLNIDIGYSKNTFNNLTKFYNGGNDKIYVASKEFRNKNMTKNITVKIFLDGNMETIPSHKGTYSYIETIVHIGETQNNNLWIIYDNNNNNQDGRYNVSLDNYGKMKTNDITIESQQYTNALKNSQTGGNNGDDIIRKLFFGY